jgi:hypothetical protein
MPRNYTRKTPRSPMELRAPAVDVKAREAERDLQVDTRTEAQKWLGEPPRWRSALAHRDAKSER